MTLEEFFLAHPETAIAFSGGVDSACLLEAATRYAKRCRAYYVQSPFQPRFEREDAERVANALSAELTVLPLDVLAVGGVAENPADRCYLCKTAILSAIWKQARADGFSVLLDGTNASDEDGDRPGMRALRELGVLSPLRLCGLHKAEIRRRSREAGLFTWDKPAYACLATRIPTGEVITAGKLEAVERAESFLSALGFTDFRVRTQDGHARIQLRQEQLPLLLEHRAEIAAALRQWYRTVSLDLEVRE